MFKEELERYRPAEEVQFTVGRAERRVLFNKATGRKKGEEKQSAAKWQESKRKQMGSIVPQILLIKPLSSN